MLILITDAELDKVRKKKRLKGVKIESKYCNLLNLFFFCFSISYASAKPISILRFGKKMVLVKKLRFKLLSRISALFFLVWVALETL